MRAAAEGVLDGRATVAEAARSAGVPYSTMHGWVRRLGAERDRAEAAREAEEERRRRAAAALAGRPGEVVLLEVETPRGASLVVADRARDGAPSGTVRRVSGAGLGPVSRVRGRVRRRWVCDARELARAVAAAVANDPASSADQRRLLRSMTGEG